MASRRARRVVAASSGLPKLYIPADGMGNESPELKAAKTLRRLFTFVAIRVVQGHIEGAGNGAHCALYARVRAEKGPERTKTDRGTLSLSLARADGGFAPQVTGRDGSCLCPDYDDLRRAMEEIPLGDGDSWIDAFMSINSEVALRIIIARETYMNEFDYEYAKRLTEDMIQKGNAQLMKRHATRSLGVSSDE